MHIEGTQEIRDLREALETIMRDNGDRWLRFIAAILRNREDAEDAMQEAVRRVLARDISFSSEEQMRMYLGRAIGNAALERFNRRKRERRRQIPVQEHIFLPSNIRSACDRMEHEEHAAERERLLGRLQEGLTRLPLKQYEALRLTILECGGASIRDVGMNNGIPYSTLRHRSKQGLRRLRRFLREEGRKGRSIASN
jgi:RNA polymerase sigma factor (sigma-70 family)